MANHGRQPSVAGGIGPVRSAVASLGGDATMAHNGLTFGRMVDGGRAGRLFAEYRKVSGPAGGATILIPHSLGVVPAWCVYLGADGAGGANTILTAGWFEWEKWTASEVRMRAVAHIGNVQGSTMWFLIGGER